MVRLTRLALALLATTRLQFATALPFPRPSEFNHPYPSAKEAFTGGLSPTATALCVIDVNQAMFSLGQAGTSLRDAINTCKTPINAPDGPAICSVPMNNLIRFVSQVATFLSAAASDCASTPNVPAYCAADITNLLLSLANIGSSASSITLSCQGVDVFPNITNGTRRLQDALLDAVAPTASAEEGEAAENAFPEPRLLKLSPADEARRQRASDAFVEVQEAIMADKNRKVSIANCYFNVMQALHYLARSGLAINAAVQDCNPDLVHTSGATGQMVCAVDISAVIASFGYAAQAISYAVAQCPVQGKRRAVCAGDISGIIASTAGLAASGASFYLTCGSMGPAHGRRLEPGELGELGELGEPGEPWELGELRGLAANATTPAVKSEVDRPPVVV